jgi:hypothetical protein
MASVKKDIRTNQALEVIQRSTEGMSIVQACKEIGISRSTFYYFTSRNPDAIASFQEMQHVAAMQQFALILDNHFETLHKVIQEGLADTTKPKQRLAILEYLDKKMADLSDRLGAHDTQNSSNVDFLVGPNLVPAISSYTNSDRIIPELDTQEG